METIEGSKNLKVSEDFHCKYATVPKDFEWDGNSAPVGLIIKRYSEGFRASLVHDYLCRGAIDAQERKAADEAYRAILVELGLVDPWRIKLGYLGVRIGAFFGIGVHYPHWTDKLRGSKDGN